MRGSLRHLSRVQALEVRSHLGGRVCVCATDAALQRGCGLLGRRSVRPAAGEPLRSATCMHAQLLMCREDGHARTAARGAAGAAARRAAPRQRWLRSHRRTCLRCGQWAAALHGCSLPGPLAVCAPLPYCRNPRTREPASSPDRHDPSSVRAGEGYLAYLCAGEYPHIGQLRYGNRPEKICPKSLCVLVPC